MEPLSHNGSMQEQLLPLFPLPLVLLPRTPLPLHIFEDRYKEMIGEALAGKTEFGIVLAREQGILNTGCTAVIEQVLKRYPDGRMDVLVAGRRRFEILTLNDEKSYLRGAVEFFDDEEGSAEQPGVRERAVEAYNALREIDPDTPDAEMGDPQLSFQLAQAIDDADFRLRLLRTRSEAARLEQLVEFCRLYLPKQREIARMKRVQPLNGHGRLPTGS